jgi:hypothetical protein
MPERAANLRADLILKAMDELLAELTAAAPVLDRETKEEIIRAQKAERHRYGATRAGDSFRRHPGRSCAVARGAEGEVTKHHVSPRAKA